MKSAKPPKPLITSILSKLPNPNNAVKTPFWKNLIGFPIVLIMGLCLIGEGLSVESLVCHRGEKTLNTCEIFQSTLWQQKSIKQFPLSSLKEARVEESRYKGKTMTTCRLLTTEGKLSLGSIGGGKTLEKRRIVSKINAFLQNPKQLNLSVKESLSFSLILIGFLLILIALYLFYCCFYLVVSYLKNFKAVK